MSARGYALHSLYPQLSFSFLVMDRTMSTTKCREIYVALDVRRPQLRMPHDCQRKSSSHLLRRNLPPPASTNRISQAESPSARIAFLLPTGTCRKPYAIKIESPRLRFRPQLVLAVVVNAVSSCLAWRPPRAREDGLSPKASYVRTPGEW